MICADDTDHTEEDLRDNDPVQSLARLERVRAHGDLVVRGAEHLGQKSGREEETMEAVEGRYDSAPEEHAESEVVADQRGIVGYEPEVRWGEGSSDELGDGNGDAAHCARGARGAQRSTVLEERGFADELSDALCARQRDAPERKQEGVVGARQVWPSGPRLDEKLHEGFRGRVDRVDRGQQRLFPRAHVPCDRGK